MKYEVSANACRVCLRKNQKLQSPIPFEKLQDVTGILISQTEIDKNPKFIPNKICRNCEISLNQAYSFRTLARKSDGIIRMHCFNQNKDNIIVALNNGKTFKLPKELTLKILKKEKTEPAEDNCKSAETEDYYEAEFLDEYTDTICNTEYDEIATQNIPEEFEYSEIHEEIQEEEISPDAVEQIEPVESEMDDPNLIAERLKSTNKYDVISWARANPRDVATFKIRVKPSIESKANKANICEFCGNIYYTTFQFKAHMRKHTNERPYSCEICSKQFVSSQSLKKHIQKHTGHKRYKCDYCDRRFHDNQSKKAHESVHTGIKPYECTQCEKSFAYSCILKKHLLIHKNIKLFNCKYCNKQFRLMHHLKQHQSTQSHQETMSQFGFGSKATEPPIEIQ